MPKLTAHEIKAFIQEHNDDSNGHLRLGQRFCNKYNINDDPQLFYEQDDSCASRQLWEKYFDQSS